MLSNTFIDYNNCFETNKSISTVFMNRVTCDWNENFKDFQNYFKHNNLAFILKNY